MGVLTGERIGRRREKGEEEEKEKKKDAAEQSGPIDLKLIKTDPEKLYPLIYFALKKALKEWEEFMNERPGWGDCNSVY